MATFDRKLNLSINPELINKNEAGNLSLFANGWINCELTPAELVDIIKRGIAYCPQLKGSRCTDNFLAADLASVDVDHGLSLPDAFAHPLVKEHALAVYTTCRHTPEAHRFRVIFALPRTITKPGQMVSVTRSLTRMLGGDHAAVDATRICFGNTAADIHHLGREVSPELLGELLSDAFRADELDSGSRLIVSRRSLIALDPDQEVRLSDGGVMRLADAPDKAAVHCPVHADIRASAFVVRSRVGVRGVHCSACDKTYWSNAAHATDAKFDDFVETAREVAAKAKPVPQRFADVVSGNPLAHEFHTGCNIHFVEGTPTPPNLLPGVTFVRSPKGSGKTEGLKRYVAAAKRPLLIGHRRTLIRGSCNRLELSCYLDRGNQSTISSSVVPFSRDRYGICLDSLLQVWPDATYDLIILDESEQVLAHLLSETITSRGTESRLFTHLSTLVQRAESVVALDADLGYLTYNTLARMVATKRPDNTSHLTKPLHLWINEVSPTGPRTIHLYADKNHLVADLMQAIDAGKRCFVPANCKSLVDKLAAAINERFGESRRMIKITADTGSEAAVQDFVANAKERALVYDVILCSPSLGTGVDITFPDNAEFVDGVFGFCEHSINTHLDFEQQIARVRHPREIRVWVSPRRFRYETHLDVVRHDLLRAGLYRDLLVGYESDGRPRFTEGDPLIEMAAIAKAAERASQNDLLGNFVRYREAQGCTVVGVRKGMEQAVTGYGVLLRGKHLQQEEVAERMMACDPLPRPEFERVKMALEAGQVVSEEERWALERTRLELFYREAVTPGLVQLDDGGRQRQRVILFDEVTRLSPDLVWLDPANPLHKDLRFIRAEREDVASTIARLLARTALWRTHPDDGAKRQWFAGIRGRIVLEPAAAKVPIAERVARCFDTDVVFDARSLRPLARFALDYKGAVENVLGQEVRRDVMRKPTQQLGAILKMMGLSLAKAGTVKEAGEKVYRYRLDDGPLGQMQQIIEVREQERGWAAMARLYGPHMDPPEEDEWADLEDSIEKAARVARGTTRPFS